MKIAGILGAALLAATFTAPAAVLAEGTDTSVTIVTPVPFHNGGPAQYDPSTSMFTINGVAMNKAQAAAYFQKHDPLMWPSLQAEFNATPAHFADDWNQLAFNLPALSQPPAPTKASPDAPL